MEKLLDICFDSEIASSSKKHYTYNICDNGKRMAFFYPHSYDRGFINSVDRILSKIYKMERSLFGRVKADEYSIVVPDGKKADELYEYIKDLNAKIVTHYTESGFVDTPYLSKRKRDILENKLSIVLTPCCNR